MTTAVCIVQARIGSTRLPGKVLADLGGKPLLQFMLERLNDLDVEDLVVATSDSPADDEVARVAERSGASVVRGDESDVLKRFALALDAYPAEDVIRLTADCPLIDAAVVTQAVDTHRATGADYTSNTLIRTFPDGLDVEVMTAAALRAAHAEASDDVEREHVTPFLYRRPERFSLAGFRSDAFFGTARWTIDTPADLEHVRRLLRRVGDAGSPWSRFASVTAVEARPALWVRPGLAADAEALGAWPGRTDRPGERSWVIDRSDRPVGWLQVAVRSGLGLLDMHSSAAVTAAEATLAVDQLLGWLRMDRQVAVLRADTDCLGADLHELGFASDPTGWSLRL